MKKKQHVYVVYQYNDGHGDGKVLDIFSDKDHAENRRVSLQRGNPQYICVLRKSIKGRV